MALTEQTRDDAPAATGKRFDAGDRAEENATAEHGGAIVGRSVTIARPAAELFAYWRDFTNLATFMDNVVAVTPLNGKRSHWAVKAPGGKTVEWNAAVTEEREGELIAWASEDGADVPNSGRIEFRDAGARGTVVTATIVYDPPGGIVGRLVAKVFQREPAIQARRDLRRFKQLMETGEVATASRTRAQLDEEKA